MSSPCVGGEFGRDVGVAHLAGLSRDQKFALLRVGERQLLQIAFDFETDIGKLALKHGIAHIVAGRLRQHQRQVAVHLAGVATAQAALQVKPARLTGDVGTLPAQLGLALSVGVGKAQFAQLQIVPTFFERPQELGRKRLKGYARLFENTGELDRALCDLQLCLAPAWGQLEIQGGVLQAWPTGRHGALGTGLGGASRQRQAAGTTARRQVHGR